MHTLPLGNIINNATRRRLGGESSIEDSMKSWALGTGQPHANLLESPVLLNSDSEPQPIVQYREVNYRHPAWFPTITFRQVAQYSTRPFLTHGQ